MRSLLLGVLIPLALALGAGACGDDDDPSTFQDDGYPFTFEYPADFETSDDVTFDSDLGATADDTTAVGIDGANGIVLQRFTLAVEVDDANVDQAKAEFDALLQDIDPDASAELGETAGYPSLTYQTLEVPDSEGAQSRITILFEGDQEYVLNCQSTPEERETIDPACDQALETLTAT